MSKAKKREVEGGMNCIERWIDRNEQCEERERFIREEDRGRCMES
jgi:hypothetical protein